MPFAAVNGQRLYCETAGKGEVAVLLHGSFANSDLFLEEPAAWLSSRLQAVRIDRRGHGRSGIVAPYVKFEDEVADLAALLDVLPAGAAHFFSHDDGGDVAIAFALAHPERTLSLCLLSPTVEGFAWSLEAALARAGFLRDFVQDPARAIEERYLTSPAFEVARAREGVFDRLAGIYRQAKVSGSSMGRPAHAGMTHFERLGSIRARTCVLVGDRENRQRLACALAIARGIPGATYTEFSGLSRFLHAEDPPAVLRKLGEFYGRGGS